MLLAADEDEALLLSRCRRYEPLDERCQQLVRGYLRAQLDARGTVTKRAWIEASGLAATTAKDTLRANGHVVYAAIREAMQLFGEHRAIDGALALTDAGRMIRQKLADGSLSVRDLTSVHLAVLRDCAALAGLDAGLGGPGRPQSATVKVRDTDGRELELTVNGGDEPRDPLDEELSKLRRDQARPLAPPPEQGGPTTGQAALAVVLGTSGSGPGEAASAPVSQTGAGRCGEGPEGA